MNGKNNHILLVEDDDVSRAAIAFKLKLSKIGVDEAKNGVEALNKMRVYPYTLVLLDLRLPVKDGFRVLEEMKTDPQLRNIRVWVFSNLSQKDEVERAVKLGAQKYFIKADMDVNDLARRVADAIG